MRKNSLTRQARRAYDQGELARICTLREDRFGRAFGMETVRLPARRTSSLWSSSGLPEDYYHFRDNNSSVLAVAHLDTVVSQKGRTPRFRNTERGPLITSGALDDRLGAYVILSLLPKLGLTCDWLLTVGEESAASTAGHFDPGGKKYDWAIEFDRSGTDVVMYQYEDPDSVRLVEAAGADVGFGSYSDIAYLEQLGVKAFNWGVGYRGNYHSEAGYAYLNDTFTMVAQYLRFHEQNAGTRLPHAPADWKRGRSRDSYRDRYYSEHDDYYGDCNSCGVKEVVDSVTWYCTFCGVCQDCGGTDPDVAADWSDPDVDTCQCYAPKRLRDEAADARSETVSVTAASTSRERDDWTGMTWAQRPGKDDEREDAPYSDCGKDINACACKLADDDEEETQRADSPGPLISAAPPWSEHRPKPDVSHGLGVPTSRKPWNRELKASKITQFDGESAQSYANRLRDERAALSGDLMADVAAIRQRLDEANPATAWHAAAKEGVDGLYVVAHVPDQKWARVCLRCAARWPHPVADTDGSTEIHPEADCPGCDRCRAINAGPGTGMLHVIQAHLQGDSDICPECREWSRALTATDR